MSAFHFFYGTLCHPPLLANVLGREAELTMASLPDHAVRTALDAQGAELSFPVIVPAPGSSVPGVLARIDGPEAARLDYYEAGFHPETVTVMDAAGAAMAARAYLPDPARLRPGAAWDFAAWQARWGATATEAAAEYMALMGLLPQDRASMRYPRILARAAARLRARRPGPATQRFAPGPGDVAIDAMSTGYAKFFAVEDYTLRHRGFGGAMIGPIERATFVSSDAAVVLPYDPLRDRVLLIEQFRAGPLARGDANPWQLEAVAGLVDGGETPEETCLREAGEEAGLTLRRLIPAANYYPSPGAKSEYLYTYIGIADLHDDAARPGGLEEEGEDIRPHLMPFERMMALLDSGEIDNAPLVVLALWLQRHRARLRAEAQGGA